jgi:hypothetical protein
MVHVIQLDLGAFISRLGVKAHTKSWEGYERDQQFGEYENIHIGMSQRLRTEGNARMNQMSAIRSGLAKIIEKQHILSYFECAESDLNIAENACCIDQADT